MLVSMTWFDFIVMCINCKLTTNLIQLFNCGYRKTANWRLKKEKKVLSRFILLGFWECWCVRDILVYVYSRYKTEICTNCTRRMTDTKDKKQLGVASRIWHCVRLNATNFRVTANATPTDFIHASVTCTCELQQFYLLYNKTYLNTYFYIPAFNYSGEVIKDWIRRQSQSLQ